MLLLPLNVALVKCECMIPFSSTVMKRQIHYFKFISNLFQCGSDKLSIKVAHSQKQRGSSDCGLFAIAFATAIAFGISPMKLKLRQEAVRAHLVHCFDKNHLSPFPTY